MASVEYSVYVDQSVIKQGYYIILTLTLHSDDTFILPLVIIYVSSVTVPRYWAALSLSFRLISIVNEHNSLGSPGKVPRGFWRGHTLLCKYRSNTSRAVTELVQPFSL